MAKARSPRYPAIGLGEAVDKVKMVYDADYQNPLPRQVVAEHMGYNSLNGKSLSVIAAVSKYGLLEGRGDETRVSDLALKIIAHEPGHPERIAALKEAAQCPELFSEIEAHFHGKVSDSALRSYLLTKKFIPSGADTVIRAYRETREVIERESSTHKADDVGLDEEVLVDRVRQFTSGDQPNPLSHGKMPRVILGDDRLEISGGVILSVEQLEKVIKMLRAGSVMLETQTANPSEPKVAQDPEDAFH